MKQNFKLKEVLEFGIAVKNACKKLNYQGEENLVFDDWDKFCEEHLIEHKNRPKFIKGVKPGNTKLTEEQVKEIKQQLKKGRSTTIIAANFKVTKYCINNIKYNITWKDIKSN